MITKLLSKGFKGLDFEQKLGQFNLFLGGNGVGKSARTQALTLAIMGYLPSDGRKKPGDIFKIHSHNGGEFTVGFEIEQDGVKNVLSRRYCNGEGVTQDVFCNKNKLKLTQVEATLIKMGEPRIFDLKEFIELSDQKKIDLIFQLFPPEKDLGDIEDQLALIAEQEKVASQGIKALDLTISNLTKARSEIVVPAGTLAEVDKEIAEKEDALAFAQTQLKEIEVQEREEKAKVDAEAKAKAEAERQAKLEAEKARFRELEIKRKAEEDKQAAVKAAEAKGKEEGKREAAIPPQEPIAPAPATFKTGIVPKETMCDCDQVQADLKSILSIMGKAGCQSCASVIIIKTLIRKYQRKEAA